MRIVVTGASGFLGDHLVRSLEARHQILACWHSRPVRFAAAESVRLDFTDENQCRSLLAEFAPTHVVHAGALTLTGECEKNPDQARRINVQGTSNLLGALTGLPETQCPHFVFLSTDLVFDGRKPGGRYREDAVLEDEVPNPLMVYGETKLEAEKLVREWARTEGFSASILRSALIYGSPVAGASCFLDWMIGGITRGEGALFTDEYRSPVHVEDLCAAIESACSLRADGIYHLGGPDRISRYDFGLLVADVFALPRGNVRGLCSGEVRTGAPRPADVSLDTGKAQRVLRYSPRTCRRGLEDIRRAADQSSSPAAS